MPKVPVINPRKAIKAFKAAGFKEDRQDGGHLILVKDGHPKHLSIPIHGSKDIPKGTLKALIDAAGLTVKEFVVLL